MKQLFAVLLFYFFCTSCLPQKDIESALKKYNVESVPYISVAELSTSKATLLDARERAEFDVSHLENATWVGYKNFTIDKVLEKYPDKNTPLVVYCSIGVRSEDIGEQLLEAGYHDVKNLYGGIFEWVNQENEVLDSTGTTKNIHAYSKLWGKLVTKGKKVY